MTVAYLYWMPFVFESALQLLVIVAREGREIEWKRMSTEKKVSFQLKSKSILSTYFGEVPLFC